MGYTGEEKREYQRRWLAARRQKWIEEHGPCIDCGTWDDLEIDHVDPSQKEYPVAAIWSWAAERREKELKKCVVRCNGCHKKKTSAERDAEYQHGTYSMWRGKDCRCAPCVMAQREYKRLYRAAGGAH